MSLDEEEVVRNFPYNVLIPNCCLVLHHIMRNTISMWTKLAQQVLGIPDRKKIHEVMEPPGDWEHVESVHHALRAGTHTDLRLSPNDKAHSWAVRRMPKPGEKVLAVMQPTHTRKYLDFQGNIPSGYGAGRVEIGRRGIADVVESSPNRITYNIHGKRTEEYNLIRPKPGKNWLLVNSSTTLDKFKKLLPTDKGKYQNAKTLEELINQPGVLQPKLDGAHSILILEPHKRPRAFSYRVSKRGVPLEYTHKIPGLFNQRVPAGLRAIVRGETLAVDSKGRAMPSGITAGLLNMNTAKARAVQQTTDHRLKIVPFDMIGNKDPPEERLKKLQQIARLTGLMSPEGAVTPEAKKRLIDKIRSGKHKLTAEGVVLHSGDKLTRAKIVDDVDTHITSIFPGKGKYSKSAGGFHYALKPGGPTIGRVGSGLSDSQRKWMWANREKLKGHVLRVAYNKITPGGVLYGPRVISSHIDKNLQ